MDRNPLVNWNRASVMNRTAPVPGLVLAVVGLVVGILVLALGGTPLAWPAPDRPRTLAPDAVRSPLVIPRVTGASPLVSCAGASRAAVWAWRVVSPPDRVALCDDDGDDDDPSALAMRTAGARGLRPPVIEGISGFTLTHRWPLRYLVRPQLLTRH
jgi:hypothetical protein